MQPLPVNISVPSSASYTQSSFTTAACPVSCSRPLSSSPPAVPLIEHLRRLKHGMPTSPLLEATTSTATSAEPFQTSHDVGLKDLLLSNDEDIASRMGSAGQTDKLTQYIHQSHVVPASPVNGLPDLHTFDTAGRPSRPAVILKQLLEDRSEPPTSPAASVSFQHVLNHSETPDSQNGCNAKQPPATELACGYSSLLCTTSPSSVSPRNQLQPPFVQLVTSVEDVLGNKQSSPTAPLTFSIGEATSMSHLWSPPAFGSQLNGATAVLSVSQSQTSVAPVKTGAQSMTAVASSQSLCTLASSNGLQLKLAPPRMSPSRNVLLRVSIFLGAYVTISELALSLIYYYTAKAATEIQAYI